MCDIMIHTDCYNPVYIFNQLIVMILYNLHNLQIFALPNETWIKIWPVIISK